MALLEVKNLNSGYGDVQVLRDVSMEINEGEIVALLGSNGAGKTTLFRTIIGLNRVWSGKIIFDGIDITNAPSEFIVKKGISIVPEGRRLFAGMTVTENLTMGAYVNRKNIEIKIQKIFDLFPRLFERRNHLAGDLSGGEQQMLAIGRALMNEPKLLLIDEFSLGLAPAVVESLIKIISDINREGVSILIVEQDVQMILEITHRAYVIEVGSITINGKSSELMHDSRIKEAYLGI
ncbi:MAG: ABC transporter ATP-binding protein [Leptospiraceae bacterium]|jgi:branched-chain amino acid transport system ATP-binding protein|nr:ABC transporter ATP-binding protein [Leptospiraceae bacterium]